MQGEGNGYKDDFFKMAFGQNSKGKIDSSGRYYASYFLSTKGTGLFSMTLRHCHCLLSSSNISKSISTAGIKDYTGGLSQYKPYRWNHVCSAVKYTSLGMEKRAERLIYVDGELNFNFTSAFLPETLWPWGNNFTFGGRELKHKLYHLDGWVTDVQVYSKPLGSEEMIKFTLCHQVSTDQL